MRILPSIIILFSVVIPLCAEVYEVPDDFETIQMAIDSARGGDEIHVAPGEYQENIDFNGKGISVIGNPDDPSETILDGGGEERVVTFINREDRNSVLSGFTLTNGYGGGHGGGGIYCNGSRPTLENLIIEGNIGVRGGGILCWGAGPLIRNVVLSDNEASVHGGGIAIIENSQVVVENMVCEDNTADDTGGGIACYSGGEPSFVNIEVTGNSARNGGGGIYVLADAEIDNAIIRNNSTLSYGGGAYLHGDMSLNNAIIESNHANVGGGGVYCELGNSRLSESVIAFNSAGSRGGGFLIIASSPSLDFLTIYGNEAENTGGILIEDSSNPEISNSIHWGNEPGEITFNQDFRANSLNVEYCDIEGGEDGVVTNDNGELTWGDGNLDSNPLFADADNGDFTLTWENYPEEDETKSPCIDTADPNHANDPDGSRADIGGVTYHRVFGEILVEPDFHDFGTIPGGDSSSVVFTISNPGNGILIISAQAIIQDEEVYFITDGGGDVLVYPDESYDTEVTFRPPGRGFYQADLRISSNAPNNEELDIPFIGRGRNEAPVVICEIPDITVDEDAGRTVIADLDTVFEDPEDDELVFLYDAEMNLRMRLEMDNLLVFYPDVNYYNADGDLVTISARDDGGAIGSQEVLIRVMPVNDAPNRFDLWLPRDNSRLDGYETRFQWNESYDIDGDEVTYTLNLHFDNDDVNRIFTWSGISDEFFDMSEMDSLLSELEIWHEFTFPWWVVASDGITETVSRNTYHLVLPALSVDDGEGTEIPEEFRLLSCYPNPFNSTAVVRYAVPGYTNFTIDVFDSNGRMIETLFSGKASPGYHSVNWSADDFQNGVYLIRLTAEETQSTQKITLIK